MRRAELLGAIEPAHAHCAVPTPRRTCASSRALEEPILAGESQALVVETNRAGAWRVDLEHVDLGEIALWIVAGSGISCSRRRDGAGRRGRPARGSLRPSRRSSYRGGSPPRGTARSPRLAAVLTSSPGMTTSSRPRASSSASTAPPRLCGRSRRCREADRLCVVDELLARSSSRATSRCACGGRS